MVRVSADQRRRELVDAAVQIIIEEGPRAATARRVSDRAGASLSAVHYAFRDMDELLHLANSEVLASMVNKVLPGIRTDHGLRQYIGDFLDAYWRYLRTNEPEVLAFFETFVALLRGNGASSAVTDAQRILVEIFREAERHDSQPSRVGLPQLAILLTMAVDGLCLIHLARHDPHETERDVKQLISALQHLI